MPAEDSHLVTKRRERLAAWIETVHGGSQIAFRKVAQINQGSLSGLLKPNGKTFGEKLAAKLEEQHEMPPGYLVNPLAPAALLRSPPPEYSSHDLEAEVDATQYVMGALFTVMARHRPAEAEEVYARLREMPAKMQEQALVRALLEALEPKRSRARRPA